MASGDKIYIGVKSIQRGTITIPASTASKTATITAVNPDKALVVFSGFVFGDHQYDSFSGNATASLTLTNATTVTASRYNTSSDDTLTIPYQVIEFY